MQPSCVTRDFHFGGRIRVRKSASAIWVATWSARSSGNAPFLQPLGQRVALQVLHHQEVDPVLAPDVMERANVRVVQAGDGLRLALEPLLEIGVGGDMLGEHLDGDGAVESRVSGFVHFPHTAGPNGGNDLVRAQLPSGFKRHRLLGDLLGAVEAGIARLVELAHAPRRRGGLGSRRGRA